MQGWIKLHRKVQQSAIWTDSCAVHLWVHLLLKANHEDNEVFMNSNIIEVKRGQLLTGRKKLSAETGINESKIQRLLKTFEKCHMIEQRTNNANRLISILNYDSYQVSEQPVNNERTTSEHKQECKELKEDKSREQIKEVLDHLNNKLGSKFRTAKGLKKRFSEGFTVEDAKKVIDIKFAEWIGDDKMKKYIRPDTLFSEKFDSYLNQEQQPQQTGNYFEDKLL